MTKDDFIWYAVEITTELQHKLYVRDWDIYIALVRDADMVTAGSRTEIEADATTKIAYMRFSEEYWLLYEDVDIIDALYESIIHDIIAAMYESILHELSHLWFKEGDEEHVCSMITRVLRREK